MLSRNALREVLYLTSERDGKDVKNLCGCKGTTKK